MKLYALLGILLISLSAFGQSPISGESMNTIVQFTHSTPDGTSVKLLTCAEWDPKPKGCKIGDGMTLDDLVGAFVFADKYNSQLEDERFNKCTTALGQAIKGLDHAIEGLEAIAGKPNRSKAGVMGRSTKPKE